MKIFVVDDEKEITDILSFFLKSCLKEDIHIFNDPLEALDKAKKEGVDILVTDISMPPMSGYDLIKELKNSKVSINNIFVVSGFTNPEEPLNLYPTTVLNKPLSPSKLVDEIKKVI